MVRDLRTTTYETWIFNIYIGNVIHEVIIELRNGLIVHLHIDTPQTDGSRDARIICEGVGELADACYNSVLDAVAEMLKNVDKVRTIHMVSYETVEE